MPNIGWTEILIILAIVLLLFGANKLPDLARSMGRSARIFKSEVKEMQKDGKSEPAQAELPQGELSQSPQAPNSQSTSSVVQSNDGLRETPENQPRPQL